MSSVKRRGGVVVLRFTPDERPMLTSLLGAVRHLLAGGDEDVPAADIDPLAALTGMSGAPVSAPEEPELQRLLPDAYDDPDEAAEFRRLTDGELRARKTEALDRALADLAAGERIELDPDEGAGLWLQALNDVRLVLGTRLDVTEEWMRDVAALPPDDPRLPVYLLYDWLSVLQEALVRSVMTD
ncbi:MAG TPA: DUF2017 domain-containing protein [Mycobacteriales bacterium]|nr:DUF2017 domain-containing protein [Mycobacteriales bacterium]